MPDASIDVLVERIDGLKDFITEKFNTNETSHNAILVQVVKTNGRVTNLEEKRVADIERWQNKITGGLILSNLIIVPILMWLVKDHLGK